MCNLAFARIVILSLFLSIAGLAAPETHAAPSPEELAQQFQDLQQTVQGLQQTLNAQQEQLDALKSENAALKSRLEVAPSPSPPSPVPEPVESGPTVAPPGTVQSSLPEIGGSIDVVGTSSQREDDGEGNDRLSLRELELTLGQDIDPFTRFDATVAFSDFEEASLEEAYITYLGLPGEISLRGGRLRPRIGKANPLHRDQLDTVDEPLVVQRYLGVEGLSKTGLELARFLPQFADSLTQELSGGVLEGGSGEDGQMFGESRRRPTYYLHLKNYWEPTDETNLEFGATLLRGSADEDALDEVNALGLDLTVMHHFNPVNRLKWQSELYVQDRRERRVRNSELLEGYAGALSEDVQRFAGNLAALAGGEDPDFAGLTFLGARAAEGAVYTRYDDHPLGWYSLLDYRISPRFGAGVRYDFVQPVTYNPWAGGSNEQALSTYLTFYQSEFARLRLQYQHLEPINGDADDVVFVQGSYAFGIHKHALK